MLTPRYSDFQRYLAAKRTVDDRALNGQVWEAFLAALATASESSRPSPPRVLEIGCGIGTMIERLLETQRFGRVDYTAVDADLGNIQEAARRLQARGGQLLEHTKAPASVHAAQDRSFDLALAESVPSPDTGTDWQIHLQALDLFSLLRRAEAYGTFDILIAHAFLDLVDARDVLQRIQPLLSSGAHLLLTINFDGATILQPEIDPDFDALVENLYHATMDERVVDGVQSGDSRTGRHLFGHLVQTGYAVLAAGSSDWVVGPFAGAYPADEAYFLHFIVDTIYAALADLPQLDRSRFEQWVRIRHRQIEDKELVYIAHQMDYLARWERRSGANK